MKALRSRVSQLGLAVLVVAGLSGGAIGSDVPIDGRRIYLTDASDTSRRGAHLSLADPDLDLTAVDPTSAGATMEIGRAGGPSSILDLPAAGWTRRPAGSGQLDFRYRSKTGDVRSARLVQGRFVKLSARGPGAYALDGAPQGSVGVVITIGGTRFCALFGGIVQRDNGKRFLARLAPAPTSCPDFGRVTTTSTTTTVASTTVANQSTTTTAASTTTSTTADTSSTSSTTIEATTSSTTSEPTTSTTDTVTTTTEATTTTTLGCVADVGTFLLGFQSGGGEPLALSLDKTSINGLIPAAEQRTLVVRDVSLTSPVSTALTTLKNACGTGWQLDQSDPHFDCSLTGLGQTFVGGDGTAKTSPEFALLRVLTMTPANANVDGTSVENLKNLANDLSIGGGFSQILAETYGISRTTALLPPAQVTSTLVTRFVGSHPAATATGGLAISLYDAMNNVTTWASKYGPVAGGHSGIMAPTSPPQAVLLGSGFAVGVNGTSNLGSFQGIDLSAAAVGAMRRAQPPAADPPGEAVSWDLSVAGTTATGLSSTASAMFRMPLFEKNGFVPTCPSNVVSNCVTNSPTQPLATYVWSTSPWQLENLMAFAARSAYLNRAVQLSYALGFFSIDVGQSGFPGGWAQYFALFGAGDPPADQYLWETADEIAQVALHRVVYGGTTSFLSEGQANASLTITGVDVHVTSDQLLTAVLPSLASHTAGLSVLALGDYAASNADLDFFVARGDDGVAYLAFVSPDDPRPTATYPYTMPGFFADDTLVAKVSTPVVLHANESSHEAVPLAPGGARTLSLQDGAGLVYRITATLDAGSTSVQISVVRTSCPTG